MSEAKRKGGTKLKTGVRQGSFWTTYEKERVVVRAAKKASKRASIKAGVPVTITPSKWKHDAIMAAARAELARE